ncbi:MAG: hypothetical protein KGL37_01895, partial [Acidobacteriota bacterium]|nr:hypothetical protein [Acidobacteriota bacterium]
MEDWTGRQKVFTTGLATLVAIALGYFLWSLLRQRFSWLPPIDAGQVLAAIAIIFAVIQFSDSRSVETTLWHQTVKLAGQASDLKGIADSLYTRFIGKFPDNIKEICELIGQVDANQSLKVIVDYPRYGEYSAPALCDRYIQQLCKIREQGSSVQIICYDSTLAAKELLGQLPDGEGQVRDQQLWEAYFKSYSGITPPETFSEFRKILLDHDAAQIRELSSRGIQWRFHFEPAAFFLWIK